MPPWVMPNSNLLQNSERFHDTRFGNRPLGRAMIKKTPNKVVFFFKVNIKSAVFESSQSIALEQLRLKTYLAKNL